MIEVVAGIGYTTLIMNPPQQPQPSEPSPAPTQTPAPVPPMATPPPFAPAQSITAYDPTAARRVKLIAYVVIALSTVGIIASFLGENGVNLSALFNPVLLLNILAIVVGIGLLKFNKIAYHAFNVIAILWIIGGILGSFSILFALAALPGIFAISPLLGLITLLTIVLTIGSAAFMLWALVVLHPKSVRQLFR